MYHKLYAVTHFEVMDDFTLKVKFDDGLAQVINFNPVLHGEMWEPLQDLELFNAVEIDPIAHTLAWPNSADFDPETLHNWPQYVEELTQRAEQWSRVKV